ncbi:hypothetical protein LUZ60_003464 [Juncus effusus]|nr:hypothetical protein LUZ60_003464 [Juncus effusus]
MVYTMENKNPSEREALIDLEAGNFAPINQFSPSLNTDQNPNFTNACPNGENKSDSEKKKRYKKPPKPPRPPKPVPLDLLDQKLVNELTELAMKKKARIERMKALKKMKNSNLKSVSSNGNLCALVVTVIFCVVILWHGIFSGGSGNVMSFHGSPESSILGSNGGLVSVRVHSSLSPNGGSSSSSSPKNVETESGLKMRRILAG